MRRGCITWAHCPSEARPPLSPLSSPLSPDPNRTSHFWHCKRSLCRMWPRPWPSRQAFVHLAVSSQAQSRRGSRVDRHDHFTSQSPPPPASPPVRCINAQKRWWVDSSLMDAAPMGVTKQKGTTAAAAPEPLTSECNFQASHLPSCLPSSSMVLSCVPGGVSP